MTSSKRVSSLIHVQSSSLHVTLLATASFRRLFGHSTLNCSFLSVPGTVSLISILSMRIGTKPSRSSATCLHRSRVSRLTVTPQPSPQAASEPSGAHYSWDVMRYKYPFTIICVLIGVDAMECEAFAAAHACGCFEHLAEQDGWVQCPPSMLLCM
jgi:hypothetical protein